MNPALAAGRGRASGPRPEGIQAGGMKLWLWISAGLLAAWIVTWALTAPGAVHWVLFVLWILSLFWIFFSATREAPPEE